MENVYRISTTYMKQNHLTMENHAHTPTPLLKWAGGKRHIAETLIRYLPSNWETGQYFEPFLGGGAMFLRLQPTRAQLSDLNPRLIGFYQFVKTSPTRLLEAIDQLRDEFNVAAVSKKNEVFNEMRSRFNTSNPKELESAALLYALNKLCFNGLYRENSKGHFNVPFGKKKLFPPIGKKDFLSVSHLLFDTKIKTCNFETAVLDAKEHDFVYFDPPYIPLSPTSSFTSYSSNGFGLEEQKKLASLMHTLAHRGVRAMCSNSDSAITREVFATLAIDVIQAPRMLSANADGRKLINELVIRNYKS